MFIGLYFMIRCSNFFQIFYANKILKLIRQDPMKKQAVIGIGLLAFLTLEGELISI